MYSKPQDHPNFKNKGKKGLRCNRTACSNTEAYYYNRVTLAYYCRPCAHRINDARPRDMKELCTISKSDQELYEQHIFVRREGHANK